MLLLLLRSPTISAVIVIINFPLLFKSYSKSFYNYRHRIVFVKALRYGRYLISTYNN